MGWNGSKSRTKSVSSSGRASLVFARIGRETWSRSGDHSNSVSRSGDR